MNASHIAVALGAGASAALAITSAHMVGREDATTSSRVLAGVGAIGMAGVSLHLQLGLSHAGAGPLLLTGVALGGAALGGLMGVLALQTD